jgi:flavin reductase (DIM6/NTAB) family NADH-FMN oxidoreductase RutF
MRAPKLHELPLADVYRLIEPGPVVLLSTSHRGRPNVMTMSWHMMVEFTPPQLACIVSNRNHSFRALRATRECVVAIPDASMAKQVVAIGNRSGRDGDKIAALGIATLPAKRVSAPLLADCFANLECRVIDTRLVNAHCLFILQVVQAWRRGRTRFPKTLHHQGWGRFVTDGETIRLPSDKA